MTAFENWIELAESHLTGDEKIALRNITGTFDWALPQPWFDRVLNHHKHFPNPAGHVVWLYEDGFLWGRPLGIDTIGDRIVATLKEDDLYLDGVLDGKSSKTMEAS